MIVFLIVCICFFFFKQKTAYEMRISDWSSDVCSSDLRLRVISKPVETFDAELKTLVADMFETMYDAPGIGLAAIQVGVAKRILVIEDRKSTRLNSSH